MRVLRFDLHGEELDLHPYVTVLGGLGPADQRRLVQDLVSIVQGQANGLSGLLECHEILIEIEPDTVAALDLPSDADVVIDAEQLPGACPVRSTTDHDLEVAEVQNQLDEARISLVRIDSKLADATSRVAAATAQLNEARQSLDDFAVSAHEAAVAAQTGAQQAALAAREGVDLPVDAPVELVQELTQARDEAAALAAALDDERVALLELLETLELRQAELEETHRSATGSAGPSAIDLAALQQALEAVRSGPPPTVLRPSPTALELADEIAGHRTRQAELDEELGQSGIDLAALVEALAEAQNRVAEAEQAAQPKVVPPDVDAEIERLHDTVVSRSQKRFGLRAGRGGGRAAEEATAALEALLLEVGYPTYAAYVMGRTAPAVDRDAQQRLVAAREALAELEDEHAEAVAILERDPRVLVLRAERDQLWAAARDLLGTVPDDVEAALRALRVPEDPGASPVDELRLLLGRLGSPAPGADEASVVASAEQLLAETTPDDQPPNPTQSLEKEVSELRDRALAADEALSEREAKFAQLASRVAELEAEIKAVATQTRNQASDKAEESVPETAEVVAAREALKAAEARLNRHHAAVEKVDQRHMVLGEARDAERRAVAEREAAQIAFDTAKARLEQLADAAPLPAIEWRLDEKSVEAIEWYILGRVAALRHVSHAGAIPLILNDAFRGMPEAEARALAEALGRIGESVQVIYVGETASVVEWARAQGLDRAAVVRPGEPALP